MPEAATNIVEYTVSELSFALKRTIESSFERVRVRGEVSRVSRPNSGHYYFDLKDDRSVLGAVVWRTTALRLRHKPEQGLEVIATGRLTTYPGQSKYQMVVEHLEPAGAGALMALLEERRKALAAEGLFAEARKKQLPRMPFVIGVVTSQSGAVIRDILHRLRERFPVRVLVWPVRVQGEGAAEEVAAAVRGFNAIPAGGAVPRPDLLIVARGGGSIEDLWAFNEEAAVRAVAASAVPVISAVGHETDVTLVDFAADLRAPTPTGAAELAVPVRAELEAAVAACASRLTLADTRYRERCRRELSGLARVLPALTDLLALPRQRLDHAGGRLARGLVHATQGRRHAFDACATRVGPGLLARLRARLAEALGAAVARRDTCMDAAMRGHRRHWALAKARLAPQILSRARQICADRLVSVADRGDTAIAAAVRNHRRHCRLAAARLRPETINRRIALGRERLDRTMRLIDSYHGVLKRGFARVLDATGRPVRAAAAISPGDRLSLRFADGTVGATADGRPARLAPRSAPKAAGGQGDLF